MSFQKLTLYDVEWQILRVSLLKQNQKGSGFTDDAGTQENINTLQRYLSSSPSPDKLWRVLNLLNAVRMGNSGQGKANSSHDQLVIRFRDKVQKAYNESSKKFSPPSEAQVRSALSTASTDDLIKVQRNLGIRQKLHATSSHRSELAWFLELLNAEVTKRS